MSRAATRWAWCALAGLLAGNADGWPQPFLAEQFKGLQLGLSLSVVQDVGTDPCVDDTPTSDWTAFLCDPDPASAWSQPGNNWIWGKGFDSLGNFYQIRSRLATGDEANCPTAWGGHVYQIQRHAGASVETMALIPETWAFCLAPGGTPTACRYPDAVCETGTRTYQVVRPLNMMIDAINGRMYLKVWSQMENTPGTFFVVQISGLTSLLDIVPTFQPSTDTISWTTPKHPEALPAADRFQVFAGEIADLPDFGQAVTLSCSVPQDRVPQPGEFLSILDSLPDPPAGQAFYVVVGVEHAGQRRFGRQNIGGVQTGRNPAAFPSCG